MKIVTGHTGEEHITSVDDAMFNIAMFGSGEWGLNTLDKLAYEIISNNRIETSAASIMVLRGCSAEILSQCGTENPEKSNLWIQWSLRGRRRHPQKILY